MIKYLPLAKFTMTSRHQNEIAERIASHLKALRKSRSLSLDKTAQLTGVSKAMLGQIERGESSPTIATLWKIATGLSASFSSFISPSVGATPHSKQVEESRFSNDPNMDVKTLFPYDALTQFEVFSLVLKNRHEQHSTAHQIGVTERIHVTKGCLSVLQNGEWTSLKEGEQCVLNADQAHGYKDEVGETHFIAVIHYPNGTETVA